MVLTRARALLHRLGARREVSHQLKHPIRFMPHVAPFFQGISLTVAVPLAK